VYFLFQIIIHIQTVTETEEIGWVMESTACAEDYTFSVREKNYLLGTGYVYTSQQLRELRLLMTGCHIL